MPDLDEKHVLIVEDEPRNAALLIAMLSVAGIFRTGIARTGKEILEVATPMPRIDLVLLDLQLPGEDGYQILNRLRADEKFKRARIVAVTAQVMPDDVARAESVGFDGFLGKPLNFDRFPLQVRRILMGQRVWEPR